MYGSKKVVIMPFHLKSALLFHYLSCKGINVAGFWDNDESLSGKSYDKTGILLPPPSKSFGEEVTIIVFYKKFESEIIKQLTDLGYSDIFSAHDLDLNEIEDYYDSINEVDLVRIDPRFEKYVRTLYVGSKIFFPIKKPSDMLDIVYDEHYKHGRKENIRITLLVSHVIDITGAPIALLNAAKAIANNDGIPIVCCRTEGSLLPALLAEGIPVLIDFKLIESDFFLQLISLCDSVVVNTFTTQSLKVIEKLNGLSIPVLWWVHEGDTGFEYIQINKVPALFEKNIHIYCVGNYSKAALKRFRADISAGILLYGIEDFYESDSVSLNERLNIMTIGTIDTRKGQDILCDAIRKLDNTKRDKCEFVFIGKEVSGEPVYEDVLALKNEFPDNVTITGEVERYEISKHLYKCDCMVCASRDDPMPIFITEAMMFHKIVICSENTGFRYLIEDGINGFIYSPNNADELCNKLEYYINDYSEFAAMKSKSRKTYEDNFTFKKFSKELNQIMNEIEGKGSV